MSEPTTTLRFPGRLHVRAKMEATKHGLSLQDFVGRAVEVFIDGAGVPSKTIMSPTARRIAALPDRHQKVVDRFVAMINLAPEFYLTAIDQYVSGMLALFRRVDRGVFEKKTARSIG